MAFVATWMDLKIVLLSEVSQTEKRQISYDFSYMWDLKNWCNVSNFKRAKIESIKREFMLGGVDLMCTRGWFISMYGKNHHNIVK